MLLPLLALSLPTHAAMLDQFGCHVSFPYDNGSTPTATWGSEGSSLDINEEGLGSGKCTGNSFTFAWVMTSPIPVGSHGQPWDNADFTVSVPRTKPDDSFGLGNVFIRHSPDLKHWTDWQVLEQQPEHPAPNTWQSPRKGTLAIPRVHREHYRKLCDEFAAANPDVPFRNDAVVRWILKEDPNYFAKEIPFIGYVQVMVEAGLSDQQRIRGIHFSAFSTIDGMLYRIPAKDRKELQGRWSFVVEDYEADRVRPDAASIIKRSKDDRPRQSEDVLQRLTGP